MSELSERQFLEWWVVDQFIDPFDDRIVSNQTRDILAVLAGDSFQPENYSLLFRKQDACDKHQTKEGQSEQNLLAILTSSGYCTED